MKNIEPRSALEQALVRLCARYMDMTAMVVIVLVISPREFEGHFYITALCGALLSLLMEPLFLSTHGYTPGKLLFKIRVRHKTGEKLTYLEGLDRCYHLVKYGFLYFLPFFSLYAHYQSFQDLKNNGIVRWDTIAATSVSHTRCQWLGIMFTPSWLYYRIKIAAVATALAFVIFTWLMYYLSLVLPMIEYLNPSFVR